MLLLASLCAATLGCQQGFFQRTASSLREPILLGAESLPFSFFPSVPQEAEAGLHSMHHAPTLVGAVLHGRAEPGGRWGRELLFSLSWHGTEQIFLLLAQKLKEKCIGKLLRAQRKMCAGQLAERGVLILSNVITRSILGLSFS